MAAFGGDQFLPGQERQLQQFFSFFYVAINSGSLISTFVTPIFREEIKCFDRPDCYPLAFGVPAVLMCVALGLFFLGDLFTKYRKNPPGKENIVVIVCKCIGVSFSLAIKQFISINSNILPPTACSEQKVLLQRPDTRALAGQC